MQDKSYHRSGIDVLPAAEPLLISWLAPIGLLGLSVYNFVLRILTFGIHHFWGKTEVRKRIWSSIRFNGEPLVYTGTGRELFTGFLIVFALIILPVMLATFGAVFLFGPESTLMRVFQASLYIGFVMLTGIAIYRAQRYRLNRTRWRGIRAGLTGSSLRYGWTHFWTLLLIPLTLGWISPWRATRLQRIVTNDMRFGDRKFTFSGRPGPLYKSYALFWALTALLVVVTLGTIGSAMGDFMVLAGGGEPPHLSPDRILEIIALVYGGIFVAGMIYMMFSAWYRAAMTRHFARHTHLDGLTFQSTVKAHGLLWITITNYLLLFLGAIFATLATVGCGIIMVSILADAGIDPFGITSGDDPALIMQRASGIVTFVFILSLGLFLPVTQSRATGYLIRNLSADGTIDLETVKAGAAQDIKRGEGLAQAFDIDAL
jgi:uncharacterized membrane protein YjgN (DUF898 family)